jgi:hypothetical protein
MLATDSVTLGDVRVTADGYLEAAARTARVGIQQYRGVEMGRPDLQVVNVYRDEAEVFSKQSLQSFSKIPLTVDHPTEPVTADNWRQHAVGTTGDEVLRDGEFLKIGLKITDRAAIDAIKGGKRELSVGYCTDIVWGDGVAPDGTPFQARQTAITANHIAIVSAGRAGPQCRVGDSWPDLTGDKRAPGDELPAHHGKGNDMTLQKVTVDGITVEMSDTAAQVVSKVQAQLSDALTARDTATGALVAAQTTHAQAIEAKDGEIAALKAQIPTADALDALATARAELIGQAKTLLGDSFDAKGKDAAAIRREVVSHALGDAAKDMSDAAIDGAFKVVAINGVKADPLRQALGDVRAVNTNDADKAWAEMKARDAAAWQKGA